MEVFLKPLLLIAFACLLFIGCYAATTSNSSIQNSADCDRKTDSLFAEYQKDSFNQKRTFSKLKPILDSLAQRITPVLNAPQFRSKVRFKTIILSISPSGHFRFNDFRDFIKPDSTTAEDFDLIKAYYNPDSLLTQRLGTLASKFKTDSLSDYRPYFCIPGNIAEDSSGFTFVFRDSCYYSTGQSDGRSKASIMRVVMRYVYQLRDAYNECLRSGERYNGKITVKFAIDERGHIMYVEIIPAGTTIPDKYLWSAFLRIIKTWRFERANKPGDITEVVYPFIF